MSISGIQTSDNDQLNIDSFVKDWKIPNDSRLNEAAKWPSKLVFPLLVYILHQHSCSLMIFLSIISRQLKSKINISHINFFVNAKISHFVASICWTGVQMRVLIMRPFATYIYFTLVFICFKVFHLQSMKVPWLCGETKQLFLRCIRKEKPWF